LICVVAKGVAKGAVINRTVGWSGHSRVLSWIKHSYWPIRIKDWN